MEKETIYLSSAYLAPVEYYTKLLAYSHVCVEDCDHYLKQTYRNRCTIAAPDGPLALSVPIIKPDTLKCPMKDIRISDHGNWRHLHWNALESAYNHTPFFEYYKDDFRPFYEQKYEFLADFNEALCRLVCSLIGLEPQMERTTDYKTTLQEIVQRNPEEAVEYVLVGESGPDHNKTFSVEVHLNSNVIGHGSGRSKKIAEQAAAKEALELMGLKA